MTTTEMPDDFTLRLTRRFSAPREQVFDAWTTPEALSRWFAPSDDFTTSVAELDLRVGGRYRITMRSPDGEEHTVHGVYREIVRPGRLVFTWAWISWPEAKDSLVTVELHDRDGETELVLTHGQLTDEESREKHEEGWSGCLARLPRAL